jgi:hypothetical protein
MEKSGVGTTNELCLDFCRALVFTETPLASPTNHNQPQPTNPFRSDKIVYVGKISFYLLSIGMLYNLPETCRLIDPFAQCTLEFPIKNPNRKKKKILK